MIIAVTVLFAHALIVKNMILKQLIGQVKCNLHVA